MPFRRTAALLAAAATTLSPIAPNALAEEWAYNQICLHNRGVYSAVMDVEIVASDRNVRWRAGLQDMSPFSSGKADAGQNKCWDVKIPHGSTFRAFVDVNSGRHRACVAHPDRRDEFEGFFLAPGQDTLSNEAITFRSWGTSLFPGCQPISGEAMHSKCADESRGGFTQPGCRQWQPKVHRTSAYDMANSADRPLGYLASVVRRGADVNVTSGGNNATALHLAAQYGHLPHLEFLLENGADPNIRDARGLTPLMLAILHRQTGPVRPLLDGGANPNIGDNDGFAPIYRAMEGKMDEAVRTLAEGGSRPELLNIRAGQKGYGLAHRAAGSGDVSRLNLLAELGADLNLKENRGHTPLAVAVIDNRPEAVQVLLAAGANPNIADNDGFGPLYHAVIGKKNDIARTLAKNSARGEQLNIRLGEKGYGLAHHAAGKGNVSRLTLLAELGADLNLQENRGYTPLAVAAIDGHHETVLFLLNAGADPNLAAADGATPLYYAVESGLADGAQMLMAAGAGAEQLNIRLGEKGYGLAHHAAGKDDVPRLLLLAELGADLNLREDRGYTPLAVAVIDDKPESIQFLLEAGVDPNVPDNGGATPLHHAAAEGRAEVVRMLLEAGANAAAQDADGKTARDWANDSDHKATAKILRRAAASQRQE